VLEVLKVWVIITSVEGMAFDFVALNLTGFLFLSTYSTAGYFDHDKGIGTVEIQDLAFTYNAVFATLITITQAFFYPV
jgi:cystinosin